MEIEMNQPLHNIRGAGAEHCALQLYYAAGFSLIGRNMRKGRIEADLVMTRHNKLHIVEVKRRRTLAGAFNALRPAQLERLEQFATEYFNETEYDSVQIDLICFDWHGNWQRVENVTI